MTKPAIRLNPDWLLVALLAVVAIAPLTFPGYFQADSGFLPAFKAQNPAGPPDWVQVAPPLQSEGNLPYWLIWPWTRLFGPVTAVKWGFGLAFLLAALGGYAWTRPWLGNKGGLLSAVVYTYLPLHLGTIYARGAPAEAWLWAVWPWILWSIGLSRRGGRAAQFAGLAAGLALLAATFWIHPGLALLGMLILVAFAATTLGAADRWRLRVVVTLALLLLVILVARILPVRTTSLAWEFLQPAQLFATTSQAGTPLQLGLAATGLSMVALALRLGRAHQIKKPSATMLSRAVWFWLVVLLILIMLSLPLTNWLWRITGLDRLVAQPWQVLSLAGLPLAFLAGLVIRSEPRLGNMVPWAGLVALVILASYPLLAPSFTQVRPGPQPVAVMEQAGTGTPQILLLDAKITASHQVTSTMALTLTWQALSPVDEDYTAFVHLLSEDGSRLAQRDSRPCNGQCPTVDWRPGVIQTDTYALPTAAGVARLAIGLYLVDTGDRVPVVGRNDGTVFIDVR
jgi:hypothetical protein